VFAVSAISGDGCVELVRAIADRLGTLRPPDSPEAGEEPVINSAADILTTDEPRPAEGA
jgi:hypothetical protein